MAQSHPLHQMTKIFAIIIFLLTLSILIGFRKPVMQKPCFSCGAVKEGTIFCDDFESKQPLADRYFEYDNNAGDFVRLPNVGRDGTAGMRVVWQPGEMAAGSLKKSFGRTPDAYIGKHAAYPDKDFKEVYWRMDVRCQPGWQGGGGDKLSRAIVFTGPGWSEGMMAHIWSGGDFLVMDPASGIDKNGLLKSTRYNDFANLRWLGNKRGTTDLFSEANAGKWFCVVAHAKLNEPGLSDGVFDSG